MNFRLAFIMAVAVAFFLALFFPAFPALSDPVETEDVLIKNIWAKSSPGQPNDAAAFMTIVNKGTKPIRLVGAESKIAESVVLHKSAIMSGLLKMYLTNGVLIGPGQTLEMKADEFHIMLVGVKEKMMPGDAIPMTLVFENASNIQVQVMVKKDKGLESQPKDRAKEGL